MFSTFQKAIDKQLTFMSGYTLLTTQVTRDEIWDTYLNSFPEGSNPLYRERTEYDCQCCKQFIRKAGAIVAIINGKLVSIWDVELEGSYSEVAKAMSEYVKSKPIQNKFVHYENTVGTFKNHSDEDGKIITWNHFFHKLAPQFIKPKSSIDTYLGKTRTSIETFTRALNEISIEALDTVLELISQNSLYKGNEYKNTVSTFKKLKLGYTTAKSPHLYVWSVGVSDVIAGIRNSAIGTLLINLSEEMDLNVAVTKYEAVTAPENYKRPTALITKGMITKAQTKVAELSLTDSLNRRFAIASDLTIKDTLFANRDAKKAMNVFEELSDAVPDKKPNLDKIEEILIDDFMTNVVPKAESIEIIVENKHSNNLVSLIAPTNNEAPNILKWDNNFSWSYNGEVTDSMKERVKTAGGNVEGILRCSIQWNEEKNDGSNDLDVHCKLPKGHIYFSNKHDRVSGGQLDVDITRPNSTQTSDGIAVENITWQNLNKMPNGKYKFYVNNYSGRNTNGFRAQVEMDGVLHEFDYNTSVKQDIPIATVTLKNGKFTIDCHLDSSKSTKEIWGIQTHSYQNVSMITYSPNYWDSAGKNKGNKHWFFMLTNCINPDPARGFYNEFLRDDLTEHRKVFEVLSSKLKAPSTDDQLSGIGFSSTKRNSVLIKVSGAFSRILKVNF